MVDVKAGPVAKAGPSRHFGGGGQLTPLTPPPCAPEGNSDIVEIALVAAEPTRKWRHTVKICLQPMEYMLTIGTIFQTDVKLPFCVEIHVLLISNETTGVDFLYLFRG